MRATDLAYLKLRLEALWRQSPEAREALRVAMKATGITDPLHASPEQLFDVSLKLFDLDGHFPEAAAEALAQALHRPPRRSRPAPESSGQ